MIEVGDLVRIKRKIARLLDYPTCIAKVVHTVSSYAINREYLEEMRMSNIRSNSRDCLVSSKKLLFNQVFYLDIDWDGNRVADWSPSRLEARRDTRSIAINSNWVELHRKGNKRKRRRRKRKKCKVESARNRKEEKFRIIDL